MDGENVKTNCQDCGESFAYAPVIIDGRERFSRTRCQSCMEKAALAYDVAEKDAQRLAKIGKWHSICPPLYRDTDAARINQVCAMAALTWDVNGSRGLGLLGVTGAGKTRALFLALHGAFDAGKRCRSISHNLFSKTVQSAFAGEGAERNDARALLVALQKCDVLLLDDLGKPPPTERADAELEELVEVRTSNLLPILWSANGSSAWLIKRMGPDRGEPLVRRLSEFSEIPKL